MALNITPPAHAFPMHTASSSQSHTPQTTVLILPGLGNSGPKHWQSEWEQLDSTMHRVMQDEWDAPKCAAWVRKIDDTISQQSLPVVLVTHSSSCALVAHWAENATSESLARVKGALLVGPSDPTGPNYPVGPTGFAPVPLNRLPFPSIVVASDNDMYVTEAQARVYAQAWGSRFVLVHGAGHINSDSGLGEWADGLALLRELRE